ncbi:MULTISPECIES: hypothetical protein [unclassified Thiomonas]|uniref:hypothetical protein n=1 Tax=unclassified Thiomonas TaxID=2625466 RepID=UPI0012DE4C52|nr:MULTISPECIES: hypothetical protein [unclassified Thiomonas]
MDKPTRNLLVQRIREIDTSSRGLIEWVPKDRDELKRLASAIEDLQRQIEASPQAWALEEAHEQAHGPQAYEVAMWHLYALAESARRAEEQLPPAQGRPALAFAAAAWVHFKSFEMNGPPPLTDTGPGVAELSALCEEAGLLRSDASIRKALSKAVKAFDPHCPSDELSAFLNDLGRVV